MHLSILSLAAATSEDSTADIIQGNCQAQVRSPKVQSPKVKTKRTWADTIITCLRSSLSINPNF